MMAKLKVGDIVMDSDGIRIGPGEATTRSVDAARATRDAPEIERLMLVVRRLPGTGIAYAAIGIGAMLTCCVVALSLGVGVLLATPSFLFGLGAGSSIGLAVAGLGAAKMLNARRSEANRRVEASAVYRQRVTRLMPHLLKNDNGHTVERLAELSGITCAAATETLFEAKHRRAIEEELNLDTGEWYYVAARDEAGKRGDTLKHLSLEDRRHAELDSSKKK